MAMVQNRLTLPAAAELVSEGSVNLQLPVTMQCLVALDFAGSAKPALTVENGELHALLRAFCPVPTDRNCDGSDQSARR